MSDEFILRCENATKVFNGKYTILKDVNLKVRAGDFISVLGESGSGKSTLLSLLGGMDFATSGRVLFEGMDLGRMREKDLASLRRTKIGFVFQFFNLAPYLTVRENILLPIILDNKNVRKYSDEISRLTEYLNISGILHKMPDALSGGERQRVAIARGLAYRPRMILLDEPTGNLDSKNSTEIMLLLRRINAETGTTIIQVTHSERNASYGNRIIRIADGSVSELADLSHFAPFSIRLGDGIPTFGVPLSGPADALSSNISDCDAVANDSEPENVAESDSRPRMPENIDVECASASNAFGNSHAEGGSGANISEDSEADGGSGANMREGARATDGNAKSTDAK